jgi:Flp pilus assembly protein TadD
MPGTAGGGRPHARENPMKEAVTKTARSKVRRPVAAPPVKEKEEDKPAAGAAGPSIGPQEQAELFDRAIESFRAGGFAQAKRLFERAAAGPVREMAHSARVHARICERRMGEAAAPSDAEGHYNYGIALINRRELDRAEAHLQQALKLAPNGDHIHYALALARGLRGEIRLASESLRRAIEINPRNRTQARNDPDFAEFSHLPPLAALLFPDRDRRA